MKVVYAGSFDPITVGHLWVIEQAIKMFDEVIIAIGVNPDKKYMFTLDERLDMLKKIIPENEHIKIDTFTNEYLIKYAQKVEANYIVRGIRSQIDFEYEKQMCNVNRDFSPFTGTVFLIPPAQYIDISSNFVKGLVGPEGWENIIGRYVPDIVKRYFVKKYKKGKIKWL